jgi:hypothetical protein
MGKPKPPKNQLQLSVGNIGILIRPNDPPGKYRLVAHVTDNIANVSLDLERTFTVADPKSAAPK